MADKIAVDVTGKSKYEVTQGMAYDILFRIEERRKEWLEGALAGLII
jgi:hypothetical protein